MIESTTADQTGELSARDDRARDLCDFCLGLTVGADEWPDDVLFDLLNRELLEAFIELKRRECARWRTAVTDWEQREYGRVY